MGLHRRAIDDPQPDTGALGGGRRGLRSALQPVGTAAGSRIGELLRGACYRLACRPEHADRLHRPVGRADAHAKERGVCQKMGSLGWPHLGPRRSRPGTDPGGAPLAGRRHAPDLAAAGDQQFDLHGPLLCNRMDRTRTDSEPLN